MANEQDEKDAVFTLTPPIGGLFGIGNLEFYHIKLLNLAEACGITGLAGWLILIAPFTMQFKFIMLVCICVPLFAFCVKGMEGTDIVGYMVQVVTHKMSGKVYQYQLPSKAKPKKASKKTTKTNKKKGGRKWGEKILIGIADRLEEE